MAHPTVRTSSAYDALPRAHRVAAWCLTALMLLPYNPLPLLWAGSGCPHEAGISHEAGAHRHGAYCLRSCKKCRHHAAAPALTLTPPDDGIPTTVTGAACRRGAHDGPQLCGCGPKDDPQPLVVPTVDKFVAAGHEASGIASERPRRFVPLRATPPELLPRDIFHPPRLLS